jgi:hypothetical protein
MGMVSGWQDYKTILIDCSNSVRHARLHQGRNQPELVNDTMDNWADFLRKEAKDKKLSVIDTSLMNEDDMVNAIDIVIKHKKIEQK